MQSSKLGARTWLIAIYLLSASPKGVSSVSLAKHLGITQPTAWHLGHRIRQAWVDGDDPLMVGPVEVDETYVGGKDRNRPSGERGGQRGPTGKAPVMGAADRHTGSVSLQAVDKVDGSTAVGFIAGRVCYGGVVFTDEARVYQRLRRFGYRHGRVAHSKGEYRRGMASTNRIEGVWALLKRSYVGTYHWMSQKHLHRYCAEVENRVNKTTSLTHTYDRLIGRQLRYADLVA
ncbi:IS1595 family transposase [Candidatus Poriferisocius sp.]|uniref:IS1595 family transposase n=1 Tax=Candidatus Poriferisocius sp. TaxID=3101276 RepID=UPI003B012F1E